MISLREPKYFSRLHTMGEVFLDEAQSDKQKDTIRQRCASYLDRAEKVKEYLKVRLGYCGSFKFFAYFSQSLCKKLASILHLMIYFQIS